MGSDFACLWGQKHLEKKHRIKGLKSKDNFSGRINYD